MTDDELLALAELMLSANGPPKTPHDLCPIVYGKPYATGIAEAATERLFIALRDETYPRYPGDLERARKIAAVLTYLELHRNDPK